MPHLNQFRNDRVARLHWQSHLSLSWPLRPGGTKQDYKSPVAKRMAADVYEKLIDNQLMYGSSHLSLLFDNYVPEAPIK